MVKLRKKLGIIFNFDSSWMGGVIYIINVINTLNFLDDDRKPEIFVYYRPGLKRFLSEMKYPYLNPVEWDFPSITRGNINSFLLRRNIFIDEILRKYSLDAVYPLQDYPVRTRTKTRLVSWCADFQHRHYPEFFTKTYIIARNLRTKFALKNTDDLVLSSIDAYNDLKNFFRVPEKIKIHVFHFVSVINDLENTEINELRSKYNLPENYFMISNQFHKHKNHKVLLLALALLKKEGIKLHMAMTGKLPNAENSPYITELHNIIEENGISDHVTMLGLISRNDQLQLMKHSRAVIQPSLFEGWSTVIEDAISLQVPVIASNLRVNIEQLGKKGIFFDPYDFKGLASILRDFPERNMNTTLYEPYNERVQGAANTLMNIFFPS